MKYTRATRAQLIERIEQLEDALEQIADAIDDAFYIFGDRVAPVLSSGSISTHNPTHDSKQGTEAKCTATPNVTEKRQ